MWFAVIAVILSAVALILFVLIALACWSFFRDGCFGEDNLLDGMAFDDHLDE